MEQRFNTPLFIAGKSQVDKHPARMLVVMAIIVILYPPRILHRAVCFGDIMEQLSRLFYFFLTRCFREKTPGVCMLLNAQT